MTHYKRIIISGSLITKSNFHIGTGKQETGKEQTLFNQLCLDNNGKPYIPASSLRGYLRSIFSQLERVNENKIFGIARQASDKDHAGNSGSIRIYDCRWDSDGYNSQFISQASIDPVTGTAKHHHLATHAIIPPNSRFKVDIELDDASEEDLNDILKALQTLSKENKGKLGQGKSTGQGECHWELEKQCIKVLTEEKLKQWLTQKTTQEKSKRYKKKATVKEEKRLETYFETLEVKTLDSFSPRFAIIDIHLSAKSPLLINDTQAVQHRIEENKNTQNTVPDLIYTKRNNQVIIPGSTLKGWARARSRRILLTMLMANKDAEQAEKIADDLNGQLFGSTHKQGCINFEDAKVKIENEDVHQQTFNAIDRFNGGTKEGALYNVEAIWPDKQFTGSVYTVHKLQNWMKLLLLYTLKDSMEGDLVLGWGKSKGYGRLTLSLAEHKNWESLYRALNITEQLAQWDESLQQVLEGETE